MTTPQTSTQPKEAAMLAFKPAGGVFGLAASSANAVSTSIAQYGVSSVKVTYSQVEPVIAAPSTATEPVFAPEVSELEEAQEHLSRFFDHDALNCLFGDEHEDAPTSVVAIDELNPTKAPIDSGLPSIPHTQACSAPVAPVVVEPVAVVAPHEAAAPTSEPSAPLNASLVIPNYPELTPAKVGKYKEFGAVVVLIASVAGADWYVNNTSTPAQTTAAVATVKPSGPASTVVSKPADPVLKATPAAPAAQVVSVPVASTALPPPPPLPSPSPASFSPAKQAQAKVHDQQPEPGNKDKIVLLNPDEVIKQKEDIPSPGKFVLLKADPKPANSTLQINPGEKE